MSWLVRKDRIIIRSFEVRVRIGGQPYGSGKGRTKKAAEQKAAYQAIIMYRSMK